MVLTISRSRSILTASTQSRRNAQGAAVQSDIADMAFTLLRFVPDDADSLAPIQTEVMKPFRKNSKTFPN